MKILWPRILGQIATIASYDFELYEKTYSMVESLAALDVRVATANLKKEEYCRKDYQLLFREIREFAEKWMTDVATAMRSIGRQDSYPT